MHPKGYARVLLMDLTTAFTSMKTHILLKRLIDLNINSRLVLWIRDFLFYHPQRVCVGESMSDVLTVSAGCPQGCLLSPVLFSLYTNAFMINGKHFRLFKYADDIALVDLQKPIWPTLWLSKQGVTLINVAKIK